MQRGSAARDLAIPLAEASWRAIAAPGCEARIARDDGALRFDYALAGPGGWAIARLALEHALPDHYAAELTLRGAGAPCELQLKLVAPGGASVWWWRLARFAPPAEAARLVLHRAALAQAWGPTPEEPRAIEALELAVASEAPARGTLWLESARIAERPPERGDLAPIALAASSGDAAAALGSAGWRPAPGDAEPWLALDLGERAEHGGVALRAAGVDVRALRLLASDDGAHWMPQAAEPVVAGERVWLRTAGEARWLRVALSAAPGAALAELALVSLTLALAPVRFLRALAEEAPRGHFPRHLLGGAAPWAVVAAEGAEEKALLSADGAVEVAAESFSLEPFVALGGETLRWSDVSAAPALADAALPVPSARWNHPELSLEVTAFPSGPSHASATCVRYRVTNRARAPREARLDVAIRPFQVMPAWQSLQLAPAFAPIRTLVRSGARVRVNDARDVVAVTAPDGWRAGGVDAPDAQRDTARVDDPRGLAEGRLAFALSLAPGESADVVLATPRARAARVPAGIAPGEAGAWGEACLAEATATWRARLRRIPLELPPAAAALAESLRASVGWMLANRVGPALRGGPRCYARTWIRDAALSGVALAELGFARELEDVLRWYAPFQRADGSVPCAVGPRGVDEAVEHDAHGQLVWALTEHWRLSGDAGALRALWPHALRAIAALERLREPPGAAGAGLLPRSISHEGYASNPVHAYWDDFFALRALADARDAAAALGDAETSARCRALHGSLQRDLRASLGAQVAQRGLDFAPGSLELGDFDPSATAIAYELGVEDVLPADAARAGFARFAGELAERERGAWEACTPYELRCAFAFLRLGQPERALALVEWFVAHQWPAGWRQWPEVVAREPSAPRFVGDAPHTWAAATFVRALRRLVAYERTDGALVVGAGVPDAWLRSGDGVRASGLPTHFGALDLALRADARGLHVSLGGACRPPAGVIVALPGRAERRVTTLPFAETLTG